MCLFLKAHYGDWICSSLESATYLRNSRGIFLPKLHTQFEGEVVNITTLCFSPWVMLLFPWLLYVLPPLTQKSQMPAYLENSAVHQKRPQNPVCFFSMDGVWAPVFLSSQTSFWNTLAMVNSLFSRDWRKGALKCCVDQVLIFTPMEVILFYAWDFPFVYQFLEIMSWTPLRIILNLSWSTVWQKNNNNSPNAHHLLPYTSRIPEVRQGHVIS